jgi:hypothetical protein
MLLGLLLLIAKVVVGLGLLVGCIRGMFSGEGMYDAESTRIMRWANLLGIALGLALLASAAGLFDLPYVPFV